MELFDKVYGCYYRAVACILKEAAKAPLTPQRMEEIVGECGFLESGLTILPKLLKGEWALGETDGAGNFSSLVSHVPLIPLTNLQKSWLKALLSDQRISLFLEPEEQNRMEEELEGICPLFSPEDFYYFDRYRDGDDYESLTYRANFRTALEAIRKGQPLFVAYAGKKWGRGKEHTVTHEAFPIQLQYSGKDDKFRLCCLEWFHGRFCREIIFNMSRIRACHMSRRESKVDPGPLRFQNSRKCAVPVVITISGERNSLERCMLHFANYEKQTEYDEKTGEYLCSIYYDRTDETELLIELLSFGPVIRILGPEPFLRQVRARVKRQHALLYGETGR